MKKFFIIMMLVCGVSAHASFAEVGTFGRQMVRRLSTVAFSPFWTLNGREVPYHISTADLIMAAPAQRNLSFPSEKYLGHFFKKHMLTPLQVQSVDPWLFARGHTVATLLTNRFANQTMPADEMLLILQNFDLFQETETQNPDEVNDYQQLSVIVHDVFEVRALRRLLRTGHEKTMTSEVYGDLKDSPLYWAMLPEHVRAYEGLRHLTR